MNTTGGRDHLLSAAALPSVAVVILNWNGRSFLQRFLPSVLASTYKNFRVIVADNGSTDDSVEFLKTSFPSVEIILNGVNGGFALGYNLALEKVAADYFVLLNSDVEVTPGWIEPIIELMEADREIAACQPKLLDEKKRDHFEYAGASGGWMDRLGYPFARGRVLEILEQDNGQYDTAVECAWASGAAMFVRAEVFREMRGFDAYYFAHQEEIDLCWRMHHAGYKIYVQPASVVYHVGGGTLPKGNSKKTFLNFRNNLITLYKNMPARQLVLLLPARLFFDGLAAWRAVFRGDFGYAWAVSRAHIYFGGWLLFQQRRALFPAELSKTPRRGYFRGSMLWQYYFHGRRRFSDIMKDA